MPLHERDAEMQPVRPFIRSPWGDRRDLLPKRMNYVCSLEVTFALEGRYLKVFHPEKDPKTTSTDQPPKRFGETYHVFGDTSFETANGLIQEVPLLKVVAGQAELRNDLGDEALSFVGGLTLEARPKGFVLLDFDGVVAPVGGAGSLAYHPGQLPASTFMSTRHQCDVPSLRWLTRCQLFGVGKTTFGEEQGRDGSRKVTMSFDLLSAA